MTIALQQRIAATTFLRLGRVSNLPTVWTNAMVGAVLAGAVVQGWRFALVLAAMSLFYVGGMYLNDYFDRAIDARERPDRPIPSGAISAGAVGAAGFALLGGGFVMIAPLGWRAAGVAALLAATIIAYDLRHKGNPWAPVVMGACRALVYAAAAAAVAGEAAAWVLVVAAAMAAYVAGLTYAARQESLDVIGNLWPLLLLAAPLIIAVAAFTQGVIAILVYLSCASWIAFAVLGLAQRSVSISVSVGRLIAGISLCDAAVLASVGAILPALAALCGFGATLLTQRRIAGT